MAAFSSYHHGPFMVPDSVYVPNTSSNNMSTSSAITITCFPPIYPNRYLHQSPLKQVSESASMAPELESGDEATQVVTQLEKTRKAMASEVGGGGQCEKGKKFANGMSEIVEEKKLKAGRRKDKKKVSEEAPPTGYVHVRARRGQATDSHSLAERVRREKISERMKLLQSLVPGCDRITGKALILDEIINYVQSLQNQVEFLVKKLASIYPNFFNYLDANSPAPALERPLSSGPQSQSMELEAGPTSTFFSLQPDNTSLFYYLDDEELLGNIDGQIQMLANNFGLDNLHSF